MNISTDRTLTYAERVMDGEIVAGEFVRLAAKRHIDDLKHGPDRGLKWDVDLAEHALRFFPSVLSITDGIRAGQPFDLLDWLKFAVGSLYGWRDATGRRRFRFAWLETGKGQAKALALDTPIPTPGGWAAMGDLVGGDLVFDDRGQVCRVTVAHPVVTGQDCYRVEFDDGSEVICNGGHLWQTEMRRSGNLGHGDATRGVPLKERGAWRHGIRTTAEIARTLRYKNGSHMSANHSVDLAGALELPCVDLPIPPYLLGFWLGDGDSDGTRITVSDADAQASLAELAANGGIIGDRKGGKEHAGRYNLTIRAPMRKGMLSRLMRLDLIKNKHIPSAYLRASREQRLALLQGLMDTDGTVSASGQCSFCNMNMTLAGNVLDLALSLGIKATMVSKTATIDGRDVGKSYHVNFYAHGTRVFRLDRKQRRVDATHLRRRLSGDRKIVRCERVDSVPVRCITVDSPSSMFLCGRAMIPTHNSPSLAGIGLYELIGRKQTRAEIYAIGEDKKTANVLFRDAVAMCRAPIPGKGEETLETSGRVMTRGFGDNAWRIEHPKSQSKFEPVPNSDSISGPRPVCVLGDEIHEMKTNKSIQIWRAAIAKMGGDPLMILATNTPSSDQVVGTAYSQFFQKVLRGEFTDDSAFAYIARVDKDDDPFNDESCWIKALPALGVTFPIENVRKEVQTSRNMISTALTTKRLYFGVPVGTAGFWIAEDAWMRIQGEVDEEEMLGRKLHLSLDLSQKNDLTALSGCWEGASVAVKTWYWTCDNRLQERSTADQIPYAELSEEGLITVTQGGVVDYQSVALAIRDLCAKHEVVRLVVDAAFIELFITACNDIGFPVWRFKGPDEPPGVGLQIVGHAQGTKVVFQGKQLCMPISIRHLEDHILKGTITVDRSRLTDICASNTVVVSDAQKNKAFDKNRSRGRIDGMVTIAMAVGSATSDMEEAKEPDYQAFMI